MKGVSSGLNIIEKNAELLNKELKPLSDFLDNIQAKDVEAGKATRQFCSGTNRDGSITGSGALGDALINPGSFGPPTVPANPIDNTEGLFPANPPASWWQRNMPGWLGGGASSPQSGRPVVTPGNLAAASDLPPEGRALLDTISGPESRGDYSVLAGGGHANDLGRFPAWSGFQHPYNGQIVTSHGAGRYQFEPGTWQAASAAAGGIGDFSPASQDKGAWAIAQQTYQRKTGRDLLGDLRSGDQTPRIQAALGGTDLWSTLNMGGYNTNLVRERHAVPAPVPSAPAVPAAASPVPAPPTVAAPPTAPPARQVPAAPTVAPAAPPPPAAGTSFAPQPEAQSAQGGPSRLPSTRQYTQSDPDRDLSSYKAQRSFDEQYRADHPQSWQADAMDALKAAAVPRNQGGTVSVDVTHKNAPDDVTATVTGSGNVSVNPLRVERAMPPAGGQ